MSENRKRYVGQESQATSGSGAIDHLAFRATGLREMMALLKSLGVDFKQRRVDDQGLYRLFMFTPTASRSNSTTPGPKPKGCVPR